MEFFNRFFGSKKEGELEGGTSEDEKKKAAPKKADPSRRDFLKLAGAAAGTLALEKMAGAARGKVGYGEKEQKESLRVQEQALTDACDKLNQVIDQAKREILVGQKEFVIVEELLHRLTPEEREKNREKFLSQAQPASESFFNSLQVYVQQQGPKKMMKPGKLVTQNAVYSHRITEKDWLALPPEEKSLGYEPYADPSKPGESMYALHKPVDFQEELGEMYHRLRLFDSHGIMYKFLSTLGEYRQSANFFNFAGEFNSRLNSKTADCLPTPQEINDEDIDPFLSFTTENGHEGAEDYKAESKWGKETYQKKFRAVLGKPEIRKRLIQEGNFTLADSYSLIKSVVEYRERGLIKSRVSDEEILDSLIRERRELEQQVLIDKETDTIRLYGFDYKTNKVFDRKPMDKVLGFTGVKTDQVFEAKDSSTEVHQQFLTALEKSIGKTFVFVYAHGGTDAWQAKGSKRISTNQIAKALIERVVNVGLEQGSTAASTTLSEVIIQSQACYSYDFLFQNLAPALKKEWEEGLKGIALASAQPNFEAELKKKGMTDAQLANAKALTYIKFRDIKLPRVIAYSQQGNVVYNYVEDELLNNEQNIKKVGKLRGKDLLSIQSEVYTNGGDMSFSSNKDGQLYQISELEQEQSDKAV